ncbi:MAG: hypothetical protein ACE5JL_01995 [Dehalococcoidia bacterium]
MSIAVYLSNRRRAVEAVLETWRIEDEWWRKRTISRVYVTLLLGDSRTVPVFLDIANGRWYTQVY